MKQSYSVLGSYVTPDGGLVNASIPRILAKTKRHRATTGPGREAVNRLSETYTTQNTLKKPKAFCCLGDTLREQYCSRMRF